MAINQSFLIPRNVELIRLSKRNNTPFIRYRVINFNCFFLIGYLFLMAGKKWTASSPYSHDRLDWCRCDYDHNRFFNQNWRTLLTSMDDYVDIFDHFLLISISVNFCKDFKVDAQTGLESQAHNHYWCGRIGSKCRSKNKTGNVVRP